MMDARSFPVSNLNAHLSVHSGIVEYTAVDKKLTYLLCAEIGSLKVLNLGFNEITDECLVHLKGGLDSAIVLSYKA